MRARSVFLSGAMSVVIAGPAFADDLNITTKTTSAVSTATAANNSPGDITVAKGGSIEVSASGAAVTLNSNNNIVNSGTIDNSIGTGAFGVNLIAGNTGSFTNNGIVNIEAVGNPTSSTGQIAVLLNGTGAFNGDIVTTSGSFVSISGVGATGIAIQSELNGNLTLGGTVGAAGTTSNAILISAPIDGALTNTGTISITSGTLSTTTINPTPETALAIGNSIGGGILNAGPVNASDKTAAALISAQQAAPAVNIAPSLGGLANMTIGVLSDSTNPGYSFINRGKITADGLQPGVSTSAVDIGEATGNTSGFTTTLTGGFYNSGTIAATVTSDNTKATSIAVTAASDTAMQIGVGANIPGLTNDVGGTITATTGGPVGGNASGILILSGGTLSSITNAGTLSASANTTNTTITLLNAYAIQDLSGTLTSITNSGTITATATPLSTGVQKTVAADLSASTTPVTFTDTGTVTGDILFGNAAGNTLTVEGPNASVNGQISTIGAGTVNIAVSAGGTGGTLETSGAPKAGTLTVGPGGTLKFGLGPSSTGITATGAASFDATSHIILTPTGLPVADSTITLVQSNTSLTFGDFAATTSTIKIPFLYDGGLSTTAKSLILTLQRKSASELGLTGEAAAIYEPAANAAANDAQFGAALTSLTSSAEIQTAMESLVPNLSNITRDTAVALTDSQTGSIAQRQRTLMMTPRTSDGSTGGAVWAQGFYNRYDQSDQDGYKGHGAGGVVGIDWAEPNGAHFGAAYTLSKNDTDSNGLAQSMSIDWNMVSLYLGWRFGDFFLNTQGDVGFAQLAGQRTITVAGLTRIARTSGWSELLTSGAITAGYIVNLGGLQLMPQIAIDGLYLSNSNYEDRGGGNGVNLALRSYNQNSVRAFAGLTAGDSFALGGGSLVPQVLAGWSHEFLTTPSEVEAAFSVSPQATFDLTGPQIESSRFVGGAGIDFIRQGWEANLSYSASSGSGLLYQTAMASLTARF